MLEEYFNYIETMLVCLYKDNVIGFLALKEIDNYGLSIYLAAVQEKYRLTGGALSLYSKALQLAHLRNYKYVEGRISTQNYAVINIYTSLGAKFFNPLDIFIKENCND